MLITSNRSVAEWGKVFGDAVVATAILDRLLHHSHVLTIRGDSYRLRAKRKSGLIKAPVAGDGAPIGSASLRPVRRKGAVPNVAFTARTVRSAICRRPNTRKRLLQRTAANEREAEFSRSRWSNDGARLSHPAEAESPAQADGMQQYDARVADSYGRRR